MTTVIAIANSKGGVAKTTTCLSLGGSLTGEGQMVQLIDLDPQAHLTMSLGLEPNKLHHTVGDVLLGHSSLVSISRETKLSGLDLVPANRELVVLDKVLYQRPRYEYRLRSAMERARFHPYDFILIDCPPTFGTLTLNALTAADVLLIPLQCEYYAIHSLRHILEVAKLVRRKTNPELSYRLLVTMYDMRNKVHPTILEHLRKSFPTALLETLIQVDTKLRESPAFAQPVTEYAPRTRAARQYRALAQELMEKLPQKLPRDIPTNGEMKDIPMTEEAQTEEVTHSNATLNDPDSDFTSIPELVRQEMTTGVMSR
jgi:chromosome partitioning protein